MFRSQNHWTGVFTIATITTRMARSPAQSCCPSRTTPISTPIAKWSRTTGGLCCNGTFIKIISFSTFAGVQAASCHSGMPLSTNTTPALGTQMTTIGLASNESMLLPNLVTSWKCESDSRATSANRAFAVALATRACGGAIGSSRYFLEIKIIIFFLL